MNFPSLINSKYNFLNTKFRFCHLHGAKEWIEDNTRLLAQSKVKETTVDHLEKIEKIVAISGQLFLDKQNNVSNKIKNFLTENCQPIHYALSIQDYLFLLLENYVDNYRVDFPEDETFEKQWEQFNIAFANLRYIREPSKLREKTLEYLGFLSKEKEKIEQIELSELSGTEFKNFIFEILKDPDLLEFSVAQLTRLSSEREFSVVTISVEHLLTNFKNLHKRLSNNTLWVSNYIEENLLASLEQSKGNPFIESYITHLLNHTKNLKESSSVQSKLGCENLAQLVKKRSLFNTLRITFEKTIHSLHGFTKLLYDKQKSLIEKEEQFDQLLDLVSFSFHQSILTKLSKVKANASNSFSTKNLEILEFNLKAAFFPCRDPLVIPKGSQENSTFLYGGIFIPKYATFEELSQLIDFYQIIKNCHIVLNAHIFEPWNEFCHTHDQLTCWAEKLKKNQARIVNNIFSKTSGAWTLTEAIEKDKVSLKKKNGKTKQNKKSTNNTHSETSAETKDIKSKRLEKELDPTETKAPLKGDDTPHIVYSYSEITALIAQLEILTEETYFLPQKEALKHAQMYLKDLSEAQEQLKRTLPSSSKTFYLITVIQSSYFYLEQLLHHLQLSDDIERQEEMTPARHNLNRILRTLNPKHQACCDVPKELFLANFWTRSTYEQLRDREHLNLPIPRVLNDIHAIYEKTPSTLQEAVNKTMSLGTKIVEFSHQLTSLFSLKDRVVERTGQIEKFHHEFKMKIEEFDSIKKRCQELLPLVNHIIRPKLTQAICHLELVQGILEEINLGECSSNLFSLLIRGLLFWENTVLEELLQTIYGLKTGIVTNDHRLAELYDHIDWNEKPLIEDQIFLKEEFQNIHNICRYPFSTAQNAPPVHGRILQGELLREHPELGLENPFELNSHEQKTALNFLTVPKQGLHPKTIIQTMNVAHEKILTLIKDRIVPEIEQFYKLRKG